MEQALTRNDPMNLYQFHFVDRMGRRPLLDFDECPDDGAAARTAMRQLAQHRSCDAVEIYDGERLVAIVPGAAAPTTPEGERP